MTITKVVLIRHGESLWNKKNRFTGWIDIELSNKGREEAKTAGKLLKKKGFTFDLAYTSVLKRAIHTLWYILDQINQQWLPIEKSWRLNERHYGSLQGLNKTKIISKYGEKQVKLWRRSFSIKPPKLNKNNQNYPGNDIRYADLLPEEIPVTESLENTIERIIPYWEKNIKPNIIKGKKIIIIAHGNSLRGLIKYLDNINDKEIINLNIPTGIPIIYEFNKNIKPIKNYYLK
ncbi:2,3-diphosphoglycerate-dependent phosphoglycerate mutase [Candidatus Providencia siddallii]|uniref:2,3-bisphosphoglycerate-dependent phosphoglycerate mutase n=1 Tax=Candidatus Providencia siddallii TaxID=1715285 RepID=A0ABM9NNG1_9GAMM